MEAKYVIETQLTGEHVMTRLSTDIETRVNVSLAVQRYLQTVERFESASKEFHEACSLARQALPKSSRFIIKRDYKYYLVITAENGDFEIEPVELF